MGGSGGARFLTVIQAPIRLLWPLPLSTADRRLLSFFFLSFKIVIYELDVVADASQSLLSRYTICCPIPLSPVRCNHPPTRSPPHPPPSPSLPLPNASSAMDIYTTSFVFPRRPRVASHPGPYDFQNIASPDFPFQSVQNGHQNGFRYPNNQPQPFYNQEEYDALQAAIHTNVVMASHQHAVNISPNPLDDGLSWNYCISGMTRQAMLARETLLKGSPQNVRFPTSIHSLRTLSLTSPIFLQVMKVVKVNRSDILDNSPTGNPTLRLEVRRRLDDIAAQTLAHIAVVNGNINDPGGINSNPNECNFKVKGSHDAVDLARVRLLVMVDELVSCPLPPFPCSCSPSCHAGRSCIRLRGDRPGSP